MCRYTFPLLLFFSSWLASMAHGQQLSFGIKSVGGLAGAPLKVPYYKTNYKVLVIPASLLGGAVRWQINHKYALVSELLLSRKGGAFEGIGLLEATPSKITVWVSYLNMPVGIFYQSKRFFAGAGVYAGIALKGDLEREKTIHWPASGVTEVFNFDSSLPFNKDQDGTYASYVRRFDYGIKAELGYDLKGYRASIYCEQGLANAIPRLDGQSSIFRNRVLAVSFACFFRDLNKKVVN